MRKSELGNIVAAGMAEIMASDEHKSLFRKAEEACADDCDCAACMDKASADDSFADDKKDACKCDPDCECKKDGKCEKDCACEKEKEKEDKKDKADGGKKCPPWCKSNKDGDCDCKKKKDESDASDGLATRAVLNNVFDTVLKMSEALDDLGYSKTASGLISIADGLLAEAAGAATIEEMLRENPDLDVDVAVVKETGGEEEAPLSDPERVSLLDKGDKGNIEAQLRAIEELSENDPEPEMSEFLEGPMKELAAALKEVDAWLKKHSKDSTLESDADLSGLLITAEKEVEDYLIDKNLNFEDEK